MQFDLVLQEDNGIKNQPACQMQNTKWVQSEGKEQGRHSAACSDPDAFMLNSKIMHTEAMCEYAETSGKNKLLKKVLWT